MARVLALVPDLLFGSKLVSALAEAGHEVELVNGEDDARARGAQADVLVVDLTTDAIDGIGFVEDLEGGPRTLGFYSHVEADVRRRALAAGFDAVVPRSRMAREAGALVGGLADGR